MLSSKNNKKTTAASSIKNIKSRTDSLKAEFLSHLAKQSTNRFFNPEIMYLPQRRSILFGFMKRVCQKLELKPSTFCSSVHIFDAVISKIKIKKKQLIPLAIVALQISSKFNEKQSQIFSYKDLDEHMFKIGVANYLQIEKSVLLILGFKINIVSPLQFLNILLREFFQKDYKFFEEEVVLKAKGEDFMRLCLGMHDHVLECYEMYKFTSVAVACSVIVHARILRGMDPWSKMMESFSGISLDNLKLCISCVQKFLRGKKFKFSNSSEAKQREVSNS